ncbi:hypothetical protein LCGC14_3061400 [marine sediment metagenome]|uniref:Uncharacterized protein n=1 Tax=marine sediment metagenome TaxID=412755 RepID=A0A0F8WIQ4_9ZZZZ
MSTLDFIRGIVRPASLFTIVGGVTGLAIYHGITVDAKEAFLFLAAFGGPILGFWFNSRETAALDEPDITETVVNNSGVILD